MHEQVQGYMNGYKIAGLSMYMQVYGTCACTCTYHLARISLRTCMWHYVHACTCMCADGVDSFLHFFDKHGLWVGEDNTIDATERGSGVEEVDPQVSVVSFLTLTDVLERERGRGQRSGYLHMCTRKFSRLIFMTTPKPSGFPSSVSSDTSESTSNLHE